MSFQFLGIPPKGEPKHPGLFPGCLLCFQFLGIPPKGELAEALGLQRIVSIEFPIFRDPPEGGTTRILKLDEVTIREGFQFLGIPPKGELEKVAFQPKPIQGFQFLGIPPKGEPYLCNGWSESNIDYVSNF